MVIVELTCVDETLDVDVEDGVRDADAVLELLKDADAVFELLRERELLCVATNDTTGPGMRAASQQTYGTGQGQSVLASKVSRMPSSSPQLPVTHSEPERKRRCKRVILQHHVTHKTLNYEEERTERKGTYFTSRIEPRNNNKKRERTRVTART